MSYMSTFLLNFFMPCVYICAYTHIDIHIHHILVHTHTYKHGEKDSLCIFINTVVHATQKDNFHTDERLCL